MDSFKKQKDFFIDVIELKKSDKKRIKVYQDLVFHRFYEVLTNANPILNSLVSEKRFTKAIRAFMKSGAKTDLVWQVPNEFRRYVRSNKKQFKDMAYIDDLLWFEWIEIELFMKDYSDFKNSKFDIKSTYKISKGAKLKKLNYKVYERDFETRGDYCLLAYYDTDKQEVIYREISLFMYDFLKLLSKKSVKDSINYTSEKYDIKPKELKDVLIEPLKELCALGVLKDKRCLE
jgi:hypothetical protein